MTHAFYLGATATFLCETVALLLGFFYFLFLNSAANDDERETVLSLTATLAIINAFASGAACVMMWLAR